MKKNQRGFSIVELVLVVVVIVGLLGLGWYAWNNHKSKSEVATKSPVSSNVTTTDSSKSDSASKNQTYTDTKIGFSFTYPDTWKVVDKVPSEYDANYDGDRPWASPIARCSGPFLVNKADSRVVIMFDITKSDGEGGYCYSYGDFLADNKWSGSDSWEGSYFTTAGLNKKSGDYYAFDGLFNSKTHKLIGKSDLESIVASFKFN